MPRFLYVFRGGMPKTPEAGQKMMADWNAWLVELGDAVADPGAGAGKSHFVTGDGKDRSDAHPVSGYMLVTAPDIDSAVAMARKCPIFLADGTIEVAEAMVM
jgi:hypothetical protein